MSVSTRARRLVYQRDGHACVECTSRLFLTLDHIVPRSKGGNDSPANLQTMCLRCNLRKGNSCRESDKTPDRMRPLRPKGVNRRSSIRGLKHHSACDANYCFCECPIYLAEHPHLAAALRRLP